jgi:hypothetical protein
MFGRSWEEERKAERGEGRRQELRELWFGLK